VHDALTAGECPRKGVDKGGNVTVTAEARKLYVSSMVDGRAGKPVHAPHQVQGGVHPAGTRVDTIKRVQMSISEVRVLWTGHVSASRSRDLSYVSVCRALHGPSTIAAPSRHLRP
jgi:hypothetical protein